MFRTNITDDIEFHIFEQQHQRFSSARDLDLQDVPCLEEGK